MHRASRAKRKIKSQRTTHHQASCSGGNSRLLKFEAAWADPRLETILPQPCKLHFLKHQLRSLSWREGLSPTTSWAAGTSASQSSRRGGLLHYLAAIKTPGDFDFRWLQEITGRQQYFQGPKNLSRPNFQSYHSNS